MALFLAISPQAARADCLQEEVPIPAASVAFAERLGPALGAALKAPPAGWTRTNSEVTKVQAVATYCEGLEDPPVNPRAAAKARTRYLPPNASDRGYTVVLTADEAPKSGTSPASVTVQTVGTFGRPLPNRGGRHQDRHQPRRFRIAGHSHSRRPPRDDPRCNRYGRLAGPGGGQDPHQGPGRRHAGAEHAGQCGDSGFGKQSAKHACQHRLRQSVFRQQGREPVRLNQFRQLNPAESQNSASGNQRISLDQVLEPDDMRLYRRDGADFGPVPPALRNAKRFLVGSEEGAMPKHSD